MHNFGTPIADFCPAARQTVDGSFADPVRDLLAHAVDVPLLDAEAAPEPPLPPAPVEVYDSAERPLKIYVASSWRNMMQQGVVLTLRAAGFDVYDFKHPDPANWNEKGFHWTDIDPEWKAWTPEAFAASLAHPIAEQGFQRDMEALRECDRCVIVLPCGRSAHLEAGWAIGAGIPTAILLSDGEPELMYKMAHEIGGAVCTSLAEILAWLGVQYA